MAAFTIEPSGDDLILKNKYGTYSKKELETQLLEGHLTVEELGDLYGLRKCQIGHVLNSLSIIFRNNVNNTRIMDCSIDSSLHQVLLGTLMGDGYMPNPKYYALGHGVYQVDYCYHVAERLHQFVASFGDFNTKCKTEKSFSFWTYRHDTFIPYFNRFYSHGKKKKFFTCDTVPDLEAEGLAYWYMDDGKYGDYGFHLCVGNITVQESNILRSILKDKFGLETTFQVHDKEHNQHTIYIKAESRPQFLNLISPYIISSMQYKIDGSPFPKIPFSKDVIVPRHMELCRKAGRFIRYFGDEIIQKEIQSLNTLKDPKDIYIDNIKIAINNGAQISHTSVRKNPSDKELSDLFNQGQTDGQIALKYGFGRNKIASMRRSMGLDRKVQRITPEQEEKLKQLSSRSDITIQEIMQKMGMSFYKVKDWLNKNKSGTKCHQRVMKEQRLEEDLKQLSFDPSSTPLSDYVFAKEDFSDEMRDFLLAYEWLQSVGVYAKWCFTMRVRGYLAGIQILNEPASYSSMLGPDTKKYECLVQRGCTVSWAHQHLGSKMLMASIDWMVNNTDKRLFVGYADPKAGEVGVIYQACNFKYLGEKFGVTCMYRHPTYRDRKMFSEHSLKRTGILKSWCNRNGIAMDKTWFKPNGFKDLKVIPRDVINAWYAWGKTLISESEKIAMDKKGKYALIRGRNKREQKIFESMFKMPLYPYPKRGS